ncbi:hypothetical protein [Microbacterium elymi]|uniref:hypothetical protein n=1 Tax=Microbacterium elymi TaxID=2909587 RepID=UPI00338FED8D
MVVWVFGAQTVGVTLAFTGTAMMLAASLVLFSSAPDKRSAATTQGLVPLLAIVALIVGLAVA